MIHSKAGCELQADHTDYLIKSKKGRISGKGAPYVGLIALEDNTTLHIEGNKVDIPKGSCLIMRGNVTHAGSDYAVDNIRFHFYLDTPKYVASGGTHTDWKVKVSTNDRFYIYVLLFEVLCYGCSCLLVTRYK